MLATVADFRALLPQFAAVADLTISTYLDQTAPFIGEEYGADQLSAHVYLTAHRMSLAGIGPEAGAGALAGIKSMSSGSLSLTKDDRFGDFGLTSFGRLFYPLYTTYRGGFRVTGTGALPVEPFADGYHGFNA